MQTNGLPEFISRFEVSLNHSALCLLHDLGLSEVLRDVDDEFPLDAAQILDSMVTEFTLVALPFSFQLSQQTKIGLLPV